MIVPPTDVKTLSLSKDEAVLAKLRAGVGARDRASIKQSAEDFESLFMNIVLKSMRDTVQKSGLVDGGNAEDIYRSMLDDEYAKSMASQRKTGLADQIEKFLLTAMAGTKEAAAGAAESAENSGKSQGIKAYQAQARTPALRGTEKPEKMDHGTADAVPAATLLSARPAAR